jgi:hypothetical protein
MYSIGGVVGFISQHALGRMPERSDTDIFAAGGIVGACGIAGYLLRETLRHHGSEQILVFSGVACLGTFRHVEKDGSNYGFFDMLTVLSAEQLELSPKRLIWPALNNGAANRIDLLILGARSDGIEPSTHVIPVLVPAIPIDKTHAAIIGIAGTSPAMTIPSKRNLLLVRPYVFRLNKAR